GDGTNIVVGDNGEIHSTGANAHPFGVLALTPYQIFTVTDWTGEADTIHVGDGNNIVLGGGGGDTIWASATVDSHGAVTRGTGNNLVIGDGGALTWSADGSFLDSAVSTFTDSLGQADATIGG